VWLNALVAITMLLAVFIGLLLLRRAFGRERLLIEEVALAAAWVFVVGSLVWLYAFLGGGTLLGFAAPWTWLAATHFAAAGFGALTVTALTCRALTNTSALQALRFVLLAHPVAYLVTAAGISGAPYCSELGAASYELIFTVQWGAFVLGGPTRLRGGARQLLFFALSVPVATLVPAVAWAWGSPLLDLTGMVRYHGLVNAMGHVGLGLAAFAWSKPPAHSPMRSVPRRSP
jgi:hypothetical protein